MTPKSFLVLTLLVFCCVVVLAFLGIAFLLPGYLSQTDAPYHHAATRVMPQESAAAQSGATFSDGTITPEAP